MKKKIYLGKEENKNNNMEPLEKNRICFICQEPINFCAEWKIKCPQCRSNFHMKCMEGSAFLKSRKEIYCPVCTDPDAGKREKSSEREEQQQQQQQQQHVKVSKDKTWKNEWESHASEKVVSLRYKIMHKMKRRSTSEKSFEKKWKKIVENDGDGGIKMQKEITFLLNQIKQNTRYDTLTRAGWRIPDIYFGISSNFRDLCDMGFSMKHIINDESQIEPLVTLYTFDIASMKERFGSRNVSVQKVKNLSSIALKRLGFTTHRLCCMGLKKGNIASFKRVKMCEWIEHLKLFPIHIKLLNVKKEDFLSIFMDCTPPWDYSIIKTKMIQLVDDDDNNNSSTKRQYLCTFLRKSNEKKTLSPSSSLSSRVINPLDMISPFHNYLHGYTIPNSYFPYGNVYGSDYIHDYRNGHQYRRYHQKQRKKHNKFYTAPHPKTLLAISENQWRKRAKKQTAKNNPQKPSAQKKPSSISKPQMSKDTFKISTPLNDDITTTTTTTTTVMQNELENNGT
jgi:hypothetical protein